MKRFSFLPIIYKVASDRREGLFPKQLFKNIIKAPV